MDWIEKLFGLSPDNGSGSTEAGFAAAALLILAIGGFSLQRLAAWRRDQPITRQKDRG
jgi:hypothetical protein